MHENRETSGASRSNQDRDRSAKAQSHNADMHVSEKSDCAVVPMNQPNKGESSSAEVGEGRARTKENIVQSNTSPTQSGERVSQGLSGVRQAAKERRQERFTALLHHMTVGLLRDSFYALKRQAAPGVDGVTWKEYETGLEDRHRRSTQPGPPWSVSGTALTKSLHPEGRWAATSVGHRGAGGQDCSTGRGDHPQSDLRGGLQGLFVWVPARSQPASGAGCAGSGNPGEASELGARCGHSRIFGYGFILPPGS